eukprot:3039-Hanusia_phi.AAC.1
MIVTRRRDRRGPGDWPGVTLRYQPLVSSALCKAERTLGSGRSDRLAADSEPSSFRSSGSPGRGLTVSLCARSRSDEVPTEPISGARPRALSTSEAGLK